MSSTNDFGENISLAVKVLRETYKNLNMLFNEMDIIGKEKGFISLHPKFLRWKSDSYEDGWINFLLVYLQAVTSLKKHRKFAVTIIRAFTG